MKNQYLENRNGAIDLLRAITMALMLTVNDFWSVAGIPHWMRHAEWGEDMLGFSDIIFPTFLFCVGLSIPYSISAMQRRGHSDGEVIRHILQRSFALILMGAFICNYEAGIDPAIGYDRSIYSLLMAVGFILVFNHYKTQHWATFIAKSIGWTILFFLFITSRSPEGRTFHPDWWGILGLIGWSYLFCALIYALATRARTNIIVWGLLLLICLCCTQTAPYSLFEGKEILSLERPNVVHFVLTNLHIDNASCHLLVMSGVLFSALYLKVSYQWTQRKKSLYTLMLATLCLVAGTLTHQLFIISKPIGTLPWIFFTLAIDLVLYVLFDLLVTTGHKQWFAFLKPAGTATLTCYLIPYLLYPLISKSIGWDWSYSIPATFGIIKCITFSALCIAITWGLNHCHIKLKI